MPLRRFQAAWARRRFPAAEYRYPAAASSGEEAVSIKLLCSRPSCEGSDRQPESSAAARNTGSLKGRKVLPDGKKHFAAAFRLPAAAGLFGQFGIDFTVQRGKIGDADIGFQHLTLFIDQDAGGVKLGV